MCNHEPGEYTLPENTVEALKNNILTISWYEVVEWLNKCALYIRASAVRLFVESLVKYINQKINGEYIMENSCELSEIVRKDSHSIESAFMIFNQMDEIRNDLFNEFIHDLNASFTDYYSVEVLSDNNCGFYIPLIPGGNYSLCWSFEYSNYTGLFFGISEIIHVEDSAAKIVAAVTENIPHLRMGRPYTNWTWWSRDFDLQKKNRIPRDWGNDGSVWAKLPERGEDSIFAAVREMILTIHEKIDMNLFR